MNTGGHLGDQLHGSPGGVQRVDRPTDLRAARDLVTDIATAYGLAPERCADLALAVDEVATKAIRHSGGSATVLAYDGGGVITVDVHDHAAAEIPAPPLDPPIATVMHGRGLSGSAGQTAPRSFI
jgi:anti-sigma regulatory factor (Ser/Thr protein kinase)